MITIKNILEDCSQSYDLFALCTNWFVYLLMDYTGIRALEPIKPCKCIAFFEIYPRKEGLPPSSTSLVLIFSTSLSETW